MTHLVPKNTDSYENNNLPVVLPFKPIHVVCSLTILHNDVSLQHSEQRMRTDEISQ